MAPRRWLLLVLAAIAGVLLAGRALASIYVEYQWFRAMDAEALWRAKITATFTIRALSAIAGSLFVFLNLYAVRRSVVSVALPRRVANLEIGEEIPPRYLTMLAVALALLFGALLTLPQESWTTFDLARHGILFGETDPYFQFDLGFFVYWLPFETSLFIWSLIALLLVMAVVVFLYSMTRSLRWERGRFVVTGYVRRHLSVLAALAMLLLSWSYRLDAYDLLNAGSGVGGAFNYVDHRVTIPASLVLALVALSVAVLVLWSGWTGETRIAQWSIAVVLVLSLILRQIAPVVALRFATPTDPVARERPYLATRAGYTRRAFAVDQIKSGDSLVLFPQLAQATRSVSVWDASALRRVLDRGVGATGGRSPGWHASRAGLLALLPHPAGSASAASTPWTLAYASAVRVDERGSVVRTDSGGVPQTDERTIPAPLVAENLDGYAIIPDSTGRVAAPAMQSSIDRLAHAWSLQNLRLLVTDLPQPTSKILLHRDARDRVARLAPFFALGRDVVPVAHGDSLLWVIELYSASATYPLSQPAFIAGEGRSYFHHAATSFVNAATGRVTFVADSALEPVARTWMRRFPSQFRPRSDLPPSLVAALPPATDGAYAQAVALGRVGRRSDRPVQRHLPRMNGADTMLAGPDEPPIHLPGARGGLAWVRPLLDDVERVEGAVVAIGGADRRTYWLPLAATGPRWPAVVDRLQRPADSTVVPGSRTVLGAVRAVPIADGLAFVQTAYAVREDGPPTVARVSAFVDDSVRSGRTLADALGVSVIADSIGVPLEGQDLRARITRLYDAMRSAMRAGDWVAFGRAYSELGVLLGRQP